MNDTWTKYCRTDYLVHHGIKGQKWGVRKDRLNKRSKSGNIKYNLQTFASKRAKNRFFRYRTKQEAARVNNAVNQLPENVKNREIFSVDVEVTDNKNKGAYTYFFKNHDGIRQPYGRTKIKDSSTGILERNPNNG